MQEGHDQNLDDRPRRPEQEADAAEHLAGVGGRGDTSAVVGSAHREVFLDMPPREAFERVLAAMESIGRVVERWQTTMTAVCTTRYGGLQSGELLVSVLPSREGSVVQIRAAGEDIWGAGARKCAGKLIRAVDPRWSGWSVDGDDE